MAAIVRDLGRTAHPTLCPHGRPTIVRIPRDEVEPLVRAHGLEAAVRARLQPRDASAGARAGAWLRYFLGRLLQVTGLVVTLVAATAFFGTPEHHGHAAHDAGRASVFLPGWLLARRDPRGE